MVLNGDASPVFFAGNREREINARGTDSQNDYVDHFATAVSRSNIRTFTEEPLIYTAYAGQHIVYVYGIKR